MLPPATAVGSWRASSLTAGAGSRKPPAVGKPSTHLRPVAGHGWHKAQCRPEPGKRRSSSSSPGQPTCSAAAGAKPVAATIPYRMAGAERCQRQAPDVSVCGSWHPCFPSSPWGPTSAQCVSRPRGGTMLNTEPTCMQHAKQGVQQWYWAWATVFAPGCGSVCLKPVSSPHVPPAAVVSVF